MQTSMKSFFKPAVVTKAGRKRKGKSNAGRKPAVVEGQEEKKQRLIKEANELKQENLDKAVIKFLLTAEWPITTLHMMMEMKKKCIETRPLHFS
jgi:hypothetical protein